MPRAKSADYTITPHQAPPVPSSIKDLVAVRIDGVTYLMSPAAAEEFRTKRTQAEKNNLRYEIYG